ncbi:MAG: hypothetical protein R3E67_02740 [Pseudomonadales bacterium]
MTVLKLAKPRGRSYENANYHQYPVEHHRGMYAVEKLPSAPNMTDRLGWRVNHTGARVVTDNSWMPVHRDKRRWRNARMDNNGKQICLDFDLTMKLGKISQEDSVIQEVIKAWKR